MNEMGKHFGVNSLSNLEILYKVNIKINFVLQHSFAHALKIVTRFSLQLGERQIIEYCYIL